MLQLVVTIIALIVVGFIVLRRGRDERAQNNRTAFWLKIAALVVLGLQVGVYLVFGIGEVAGGDPSGVVHLLPLLVIILLAVCAWMRPFEGGIAFIISGLVSAAGFISAAMIGPQPEGAVLSSGMTITALPQILAGALFLTAALLARKPAASLSR